MLEVVAGLLFVGVVWVSWQFLKSYGTLIKDGAYSTARRYGIGLEEDAPQSQTGFAESAPAYVLPAQQAAYPWLAVTAVAVTAAAGFGALSHYVSAPAVVASGEVEAKFASGLRIGFPVSDDDNVEHAIDQIKEQAEPVRYLRLEDINVDDLRRIESFSEIESLNLDGTLVENLEPVKHLERLTALDLGNTPFYDATQLAYFPNLEWLDLSGTKVYDFEPLRKLVNLQHLELRGLEIEDLSPLSDLKDLKRLDISKTKVTELRPLEKLTQLERLNVSSTKIQNLEPLYGMSSLKALNLSETSVDPEQIERLRQRLTEGENTDLEVRVSPGWGAAKRKPTS